MPSDEIISEFEKHEGDDSWYEQGEEVYETILEHLREDFPDIMDQHATDLLYDGWFNPDIDRFERAEIWFDFFDYTGLDSEDFDWDAWREWYG